MKTYQYQHADGRTFDCECTTPAHAQRLLQALGPDWQLHTPICDPDPTPAALAHPDPEEQMREAALWVQVALDELLASPHPGLIVATEAVRTALGRLNSTCPARVAPRLPKLELAGPIIAVGRPCNGGQPNCLNS